MRRAVGGLVLLVGVLTALWLGPKDTDEPVPPPPPGNGPEALPAPPPLVPPLVPARAPGETSPDTGPASAPPVSTEDRLVRLLAQGTRAPIANLGHVVITWDERRHGVRGPRRTKDGYVILPRCGIDTGEHRIVEVGVGGYRRAELDLARLPPRSDLELTRIDPAAQGSVDLPEGTLEREVRVTVLSPDRERSLPEFGVLVVHWAGNEHTSDGPLMLYDLPDGDWILEISAVVDGAVVSAKKTISVIDGRADFGEIDLTPWAGIRARVVDTEGSVVPQAVVRMCREEEDETKSRTGKADEKGWVSFRDFEPGKWHRVTADGLPGPIAKLVLAPEKRGDVKSVELEWPERLVRCDLAFDISPRAGERLVSLSGPIPVTPLFALSPAALTTLLLPGEYTFRATLEKDGESRTQRAELLVPNAGSHTATLHFE